MDEARQVQLFYHPDTGWLELVVDAEGQETSFVRDAVGRTASIILPDASLLGLAYGADRRLLHSALPGGDTLDPIYDPQTGQLTSLGTPAGDYELAYDGDTGQPASISDPDGGELSYTWDGAMLKQEAYSGPLPWTVGWNYDSDFRVFEQALDGEVLVFSYDDDGFGEPEGLRFEDATNGLLYEASFLRDKLGRIIEKAETTVDGLTTVYEYEYDLVGRLERVYADGELVEDNAYDANSNREIVGPSPVAATYDDQDRLLSWGDLAFTYTDDGRLATTTDTATNDTTTYEYDLFGSLVAAELPDGTALAYRTDARNRRVAKSVDGAWVQGFAYGDQLEPIAELDGNGDLVTRFVYGSRGHVPDYMVKDGSTYRIVSDHLGSVRLVVEVDTGEVAQRMDYDTWGRVLLDTNPGFQPFGFAGGIYDRETGLLRFGARDNDPEIGRWTRKDQGGFSRGTNWYEYVYSDPVNLIDSTGKWAGEPSPTPEEAAADFCSIYGPKALVSGDEHGARIMKACFPIPHSDGTPGECCFFYLDHQVRGNEDSVNGIMFRKDAAACNSHPPWCAISNNDRKNCHAYRCLVCQNGQTVPCQGR